LTFVKFAPASSISSATHVKVVPSIRRGKTLLVPLQRNILNDGSLGVVYFMFQRKKYVLEEDVDNGILLFRKITCPSHETISFYAKGQGFSNQEDVDEAEELFGKNVVDVPMPTFGKLYREQLLQPLTVFQIFCVLLWMLDEYWQYSLFTGFTILMFEGMTVFQRFKSIKNLRKIDSSTLKDLFVYRHGEWKLIQSSHLLPGDILSFCQESEGENIVPCDCLLLRGTAVVNEANLTGESHPQLKEGIPLEDNALMNEKLDFKAAHKVHVLFGGTTLLQHSGGKDGEQDNHLRCPQGGAVVYVLRTGFSSYQGRLMRMIENSGESVSSGNWDALGLIGILLVFALVSSGYVLKKGLEVKDRSHFELLLHCILIVTSVIPPELPMQTAMAVNTVIIALVKLHIFCTEPFRIPIAGKVNWCLFDKTGTITADQLIAVGVSTDDCKEDDLVPMIKAPLMTSMVLAGCHSIVAIGGKLLGDPVEEAAIKGVDFAFDGNSNLCTPNQRPDRPWESKSCDIEIVHRHHFSAKLQRMSVIAKIRIGKKVAHYSLVKGSPEALQPLLLDCPNYFGDRYRELARRGLRVLALAYKAVKLDNAELAGLQRNAMESELVFAGFVAFKCPVRKDSKSCLEVLHKGSHFLVMITGDAVLTAAYVGMEVGIVSEEFSKVIILMESANGSLIWVSAKDDSVVRNTFDPSEIDALAEKYDLCVNGPAFRSAVDIHPEAWHLVDRIKIFARMTPVLKESVILELKKLGHYCLMCGDGSNDVGALKQADVGVALLGGFGALNVEKAPSEKKPEDVKAPENELRRRNASNVVAPVLTAEEKKELMLKKQQEIEADVRVRQARGESFAQVKAFAAFVKKEASEAKKKAAENRGFEKSAQRVALQQYLEDIDDPNEMPTVKLGDASIASPFTSKTPSIKATVDIIRQGRCALVTTLQMYQILALSCLISAYSLSVLYLDGIKFGDRQMTASGILMTISFLTLSRATPLEELSPVRPLTSIFHPALFLSMFGQFGIHLVSMIYLTFVTKVHMPGWVPKIGGEFEPTLLNTVVFLISTVQSVSVFAVNYKGRPFMVGMADNPGLLYSLGACGIGIFLAATESLPVFNKFLQLVPFPDLKFSKLLSGVLLLDVFCAFAWDRLMVFLFAYDIFVAGLKDTSSQDIKKFAKMIIIMFILIQVFTPSEEDFVSMQEEGLLG